MRRSFLWALVPAACLAWGLATPVARAAPPPGTLVAVVDVPALLSAHPAYARANEAFKAKAREIIAEQDAGQEDVRKKVKELEIDTNRDSPQYVEKVRSIERLKVTVEFDFKWKQRVAIDEQLRAWAAVYEQVVKGDLAEYARSKGIAVVLQMTQEKLQAASREDFASNLLVRAVPFFDPTLDITADVVALIKAKHPAGPAPAPAPAPAPGPAPAPMPPGPAPAPGPAMGR